ISRCSIIFIRCGELSGCRETTAEARCPRWPSSLKSGPAASSRSNSRRSLFDKNTAVRCLQLDVGVGRGRGFARLKAASLYGTAIHVQRQRSEEQTSELQSLLYIICSLLL